MNKSIDLGATIRRLLPGTSLTEQEKKQIEKGLDQASEQELQGLLERVRRAAGTGNVQHKRQSFREVK